MFHDEANSNDIVCFVSQKKGGQKYVCRTEVKNQPDIDKWKVVLRAADGKGRDYTSYYILAKPGQVCSESFVCFCFDTEQIARNFLSYFETNLFKYLMSLRKIKQDITKEVFSLIPQVDLSKNWTDQDLYAYFNLTPQEIALIEETVK